MPSHFEAVRHVLSGYLANTLVTDERAVQRLLKVRAKLERALGVKV